MRRSNVPSNATAITGVLSVAHSTALGYLALTPTAVDRPTTSTLNFPKGDARATGVTVPLGAGGKLGVTYAAKSGTADVIEDYADHQTSSAAPASGNVTAGRITQPSA